MASFIDKNGMKKFEQQLEKKMANIEFKKGSTPAQTERNITDELKRNGIELNAKNIKDLAKKMHR